VRFFRATHILGNALKDRLAPLVRERLEDYLGESDDRYVMQIQVDPMPISL